MIRIRTTHGWTVIFLPFLWVSRIAFIALFGGIFDTLDFPEWTFWIALFAGLITHVLFIDPIYHTFQTFLYINYSLSTKVSFREAKYFVFLFAPNDTGKWYPMKGIKELPKEIRRMGLFHSAQKIYNEYGHYPEEPESLKKEAYGQSNSDQFNYIEGFEELVGMLCKLAKADNVISVEEIELIEVFFSQVLKLNDTQRKEAIEHFRKAKGSDEIFESLARKFYYHHKDNKDLLELIVSILTELALADGVLSAEEEILINLAISIFEVEGSRYKSYKTSQNKSQETRTSLEAKHLKTLGIVERASKEAIKRAYRKLAMQYHPDKVSHLGREMRELAESKMKSINEAYEYLQHIYGHSN